MGAHEQAALLHILSYYACTAEAAMFFHQLQVGGMTGKGTVWEQGEEALLHSLLSLATVLLSELLLIYMTPVWTWHETGRQQKVLSALVSSPPLNGLRSSS